jgi:hypothetical protein
MPLLLIMQGANVGEGLPFCIKLGGVSLVRVGLVSATT